MEFKDTDRIVKLLNNGKSLLSFVNNDLPRIRKEAKTSRRCEGNIDKHNDGFEFVDKIHSFNMGKLCYSSFTGYYGNSSTYSDLSIFDSFLFREYFLKYLNNNKDEILANIGKMMLEDSEKEKSKTLSEIDELRKTIESIGNSE